MKLIFFNMKKGTVRQLTATLIACLCMSITGFIHSWISATVGSFLSEDPPVHLTTSELSWVLSLPNLGAILSPIPSSFLMDAIGRRNSLMVSYSLPIIGWILVYFSTTFWPLAFARVLLGSWMGIGVTVTPVYLGEITEPSLRSSLISLNLSMMFLGCLVGYVIGISVNYTTYSLAMATLSCIFCFVLSSIPESPYFLLLKNKKHKATLSLKWLRGDSDVQDEINKMDKFVEAELKNKAKITEIFTNRGYFKALFSVLVVTTLIRTGGTSFLTLMPTLLPAKAFPMLSNDNAVVVSSIINLIVSFRLRWLTKFGIKKLTMFFSVITGTTMAILALWEVFKDKMELESSSVYWLPFACFVIFITAKTMGPGGIAMALKGEMFPTELKSTLSAITSMTGNFTSFLVLKSFLFMQNTVGNQYNYMIAYISCFGLALFACFYLIETEGKTLEDIQNELQTSSKTNKSDCIKDTP